MNAIDLFAGLGGWDVGARVLGIDPLGIENNAAACATRAAAGLRTVQADIESLDPHDFAPCDLLIASPPCQGYSQAGKRDPKDPRNRLVFEPWRWIVALEPEYVAFEQVPPVLPLWKFYAAALQRRGYRTWCGLLNAADFGVPQARTRAILMAAKGRSVSPPVPTHADSRQTLPLFWKPWVSMAEALGWGYREQAAPTVTGGGAATGGPEPFGRWSRESLKAYETFSSRPSWALTGKTRSWTVLAGGNVMTWRRAKLRRGQRSKRSVLRPRWTHERPATTVVSTFCPDVIAQPQRQHRGDGPRQVGGVKITQEEALILQSFPPDYPVQGTKSARFLQIGNAVPPRLAFCVLDTLLFGVR